MGLRSCEFIDIDAELTRELFESYLEDSEGIYSGAVDFDALTLESSDASLRDYFN